MRLGHKRTEVKALLSLAILVALLIPVLVPAAVDVLALGPQGSIGQEYAQESSALVSFIRSGQISARLREFDQLSGTATGYPGCLAAFEYVSDALGSLQYELVEQPYVVVAPVDSGSKVIVQEGRNPIEFTAYGVWPNYVQTSKTPPSGVSGRLVYVGSGSLDEMKGKEVEGSIVLMDIDSGANWLNAVEMGAVGLVYLDGNMSHLGVADMAVRAPLYFPRVCVSSQDATELRSLEGSSAALFCGMEFRTITAKNLIAKLEGSEASDEVVVVAAHLDSWSIVPALSSPASEAPSIAALLEIARYFSLHRPKRSLWFVILSGTYESLAGARAFVEEAFLSNKLNPEGKKLLSFFALDLSTETNYMDLVYAGTFYEYTDQGALTRYQSWLQPMIYDSIIPALSEAAQLTYNEIVENGFRSEGWWASATEPYMLDSEPFAIARGLGFALRTSRTVRPLWGTTSSTPRTYSVQNLEPQAILALAIAEKLSNDLTLPVNWDRITPSRIFFSTAEMAGMVHIVGTVMAFNLTKSWYTPVPGALVVASRDPNTPFLFGDLMTFADERGQFNITGAGMGFAIGSLTYGIGGETFAEGYYVQAYVLNSTNGMIEYAPDQGDYGERVMSFWASADTHPYKIITLVFRCASAAIVGFVDPRNMRPAQVYDPRFSDTMWVNEPSILVVYDSKTLSEPISWGIVRATEDKAIVVFGPPGLSFMLMSRVGTAARMWGFFTNSTESNPFGTGYGLADGSQLRIMNPSLSAAKDMYYTTLDRYLVMNATFVRRSSVEEALAHALESIEQTQLFLDAQDYVGAKSSSLAALGWINSAYGETMSLISESSVTSIVFFVLLVPFCFLFEGLVLVRRGMSRLSALVGTLLLGLAAFYMLNPSLKVAENALIGFLGLAISSLLAIVLSVIASESVETVKYYRLRAEGEHRLEEKRLSTASFSFELALGNMRKRKMRTFLLIATVAITVFSLTSLTSTEVFTVVQMTPSETAAPYNGIYLKRGEMRPTEFLSPWLTYALENAKSLGAVVAPRATYYPQSVAARSVYSDVLSEGRIYRVSAILGMTPEDEFVHPAVRKALLLGGEWFSDEDYFSVVICTSARDALKVDVGSSVLWQGLTLRVVGVVNETSLNREFIEIGQERQATPLDPTHMVATMISQSATGEERFIPLSWDSVLILPYRLVIDLGGSVSSVSIRSEDASVTKALAKEIAMTVDIEVNAGINGKRIIVSRLMTTVLGGYQYLVFPLIVGGGTILNSLLGLLRERENETKVFSSLGLSPWGIGVLYISEILTLAIIGALLGYLGGLGANALLISLKMLPSSFVLNFSSMFIVISLGITIVSAVLSGIYPAILAAKLATPSLERKWRITTSPVGNEWKIPFPFSFPTKEEASGVLRYLAEFAQVHSVETGERFQVRSHGLDPAGMELEMTVALYPYEANVIQAVAMKGVTGEEGKWEFELSLRQTSGERSVWLSSNYEFVDAMRKQFLLWRALPEDQKMAYIQRSD